MLTFIEPSPALGQWVTYLRHACFGGIASRRHGLEPYIATGRDRHHQGEQERIAPLPEPPEGATPR